MPLYRPRAAAILRTPAAGDVRVLPVRVRRAQLESNDHNHADTLKLSAEWRDAGIDPRLLGNATVDFYLGDANDDDHWQPTRRDLRFVGIATRVARTAREAEGFSIDIEFHDFTRLFLKAKPFGTSGIPDYSQTLDAAWRRIVSQTPGAAVLADRLRRQGCDSWPTLGKAVAARFAKLGKVPTKPSTDAWAVWQQCVGMLGLISYVKLDEVVVTTSTAYYTERDPARLVWGKNILSMSESRDADRAGRGVGITSFNPLSGTTLEALWPPVGDEHISHKQVSAKKAGDEAALRQAEERDYFAYPEVTDPNALLEVAKRVYEERSRQEFEGTLRTAEMRVATMRGSDFDLLTLAAGDVVRVEFEQKDREQLAALGTADARVRYLVERGYSESAADVIARSADDLGQLEPSFFTKRVVTTFEADESDGKFEVDITYCNRISINDASSGSASRNAPPGGIDQARP